MRYAAAIMAALFLAASAEAKIVEETVEYTHDGVALQGYMAYDDSETKPRPGVLVFHEWWGLNDYIKKRARDVAALGYVAFAPDVYGKGVRPATSEAAGKEAGKYTNNRKLLRSRAVAGLEAMKARGPVDPARAAAIGYCFGGAAALELARSGADIDGVATFHGSLGSPAPGDARNIKGSVLVLHGASDPFVKEKEAAGFRGEMTEAGADWQMVYYSGAVHGFSNPANGTDATDGVAYDMAADRRSWEAMTVFLKEVLGAK